MISSLRAYSTIILLIFHFVGVLLFAYDPQSAKLSFLTILICGLLGLINEKREGGYWVYGVIALVGYFVEVVGVNTEVLFGSYSYGTSLGFKILNVPPLIGINWLIIIISGSAISRWLLKKQSTWLIAIAAGFICTFLDVIIEPVAIKFNFWSWEGGQIPIYNFVCWVVISGFLSYLYLKQKPEINKIGMRTYGIWILFFTILNLI